MAAVPVNAAPRTANHFPEHQTLVVTLAAGVANRVSQADLGQLHGADTWPNVVETPIRPPAVMWTTESMPPGPWWSPDFLSGA